MSSPTRLENLGRLKEKKDRAIELAVLMHGRRERINRLTNPHRPIEEMRTEELCVEIDRLHEYTLEHAALCQEIKALCEDLGEPMPNLNPHRR